MMTIFRKSEKSGTITTKDLDVTQEQMDQFTSGTGLMQNIFPNLTPYERDWLKYGFTEEEWNELYGQDEEIP